MADGGDANGLSTVGQLVEDSIGTNPQRIQAAKLPTKGIAGERVPLKQAQSILDRIDQWPAQPKQIAAGSPGENESCQRSAGSRPAVGKFAAKLGEGDGFAALDLAKARLQRGESIRIGENLGSLLQRLVLVYWNQSRGGGPIAGH
jgi:hypothetical protein